MPLGRFAMWGCIQLLSDVDDDVNRLLIGLDYNGAEWNQLLVELEIALGKVDFDELLFGLNEEVSLP